VFCDDTEKNHLKDLMKQSNSTLLLNDDSCFNARISISVKLNFCPKLVERLTFGKENN
jgi:hypothetical protein